MNPEFKEFRICCVLNESERVINIRKFIRILCILVFLVSTYALLDILVISPLKSKNDIQEVQEVYHEEPKEEPKEEEKKAENKFEELKKINDEICGWIKIDGTNIDYPVLYRPGDMYFYLSHNYKKEDSRYGSITVDARCEDGTSSQNVILHGHHMKDGQMFADLMKFGEVDFCKEHPTIQFDTADSKGQWKVFSVFKTNTLPEHGKVFDYFITKFENKTDFNSYVKDIRKRSLIQFPVDVEFGDQLLTLSTCSYEYKDFRTVIVARKLRANESETANVENIKKAEYPLMPECYYGG